MTRARLQPLLGAVRVRDFLTDVWPDQLLVTHGPPKRLSGLVDAAEFSSMEALTSLPARDWLVQSGRFPNGFGNVSVSGEAARAFFHAGFTIYGLEPALRSPRLLRWLAELERDLSLPAGLIRTSVFASKPGPGAKRHFDAQESFVVQLRGRKRWWLEVNEDVENPTENYITGDPVPPQLEAQAHRPLSQTFGPRTREVVLEPGSVMFVPRGCWHATETLDESWHLDLMMPLATRADRLLALLAARLPSDGWWREPVLGDEHDEALERAIGQLMHSREAPASSMSEAARPATGGTRRGPRKRSAR
jgi:50S ribosomal protein L16 3-hydroxylase